MESLENKKKKVLDRPNLRDYKSTATDAEEKKLEDEQLKEEWKVDYDWYKKDLRRFNENWVKAYALIWKNYCSKEVHVALEEMSDFGSRIKDDPVELLKEIETLMHVPQHAKYPPLTLVEVLSEFTKIKQGEKELLIDYLNIFKSEVEIIKRLFSKGLTDGYTESKDEYKGLASTDEAGQKKMKSESWDELIVVMFLRNSQQARYGGMLLEFRKAFANNEDKYPKDLSSMVDIMRQQHENKKTQTKNDKNDHDKDKSTDEGGASNFAQTNKSKKWACFCCGDEKCRLSNCTKKGTLPKEKWFKPEYYDTWHEKSNAQTTEAETESKCRAKSRLFKSFIHGI